jgi:hypothetical protein
VVEALNWRASGRQQAEASAEIPVVSARKTTNPRPSL